MAVPPSRALLVAELPVSGRARALWARNYRFSASRAPGVGSANSITPRAKRACSMRVSFGTDVGRLSCLRSQKRTARSLTASAVARSRCVMPARVRAARNCRPVTRLILRKAMGDSLTFMSEGSTVGQDWEGLPRSPPTSRRQLWVLAGFVELPGGVPPPGAPRTVHEPLDLHGSRCSAVAMT